MFNTFAVLIIQIFSFGFSVKKKKKKSRSTFFVHWKSIPLPISSVSCWASTVELCYPPSNGWQARMLPPIESNINICFPSVLPRRSCMLKTSSVSNSGVICNKFTVHRRSIRRTSASRFRNQRGKSTHTTRFVRVESGIEEKGVNAYTNVYTTTNTVEPRRFTNHAYNDLCVVRGTSVRTVSSRVENTPFASSI